MIPDLTCCYLIYSLASKWFLTLISHLTLHISDLTPRFDLLLLISDLHTDSNTILNTDTRSNTCWYLIYYSLTSSQFLTLISDLTLWFDLLMLICNLLPTYINMILKTNTWFNRNCYLIYLWDLIYSYCYDLLHTDINMIINTNISSDTDYDIWSNTEIWFTYVDIWSTANRHQHDS